VKAVSHAENPTLYSDPNLGGLTNTNLIAPATIKNVKYGKKRKGEVRITYTNISIALAMNTYLTQAKI